MIITSAYFALTVLSFIAPVRANMNGMDMSADDAMKLASGNMTMYFHFTKSNVLWFQGWVPETGGAMLGACVGLFLLCLFERLLGTFRGVLEAHWHKRAQAIQADRRKKVSNATAVLSSVLPRSRTIIPFIPSHDITRGLLYAVHAAIGYLLMLAVMTYQVAFLFTIIIGLCVGQILFGRYGPTSAVH